MLQASTSSPQLIDRSSPLPAYAQIKQRLYAMIAAWRDQGERFYGDEDLAKLFGVSRMTVRRASDELVAEGYLLRRRGVGTFVTADKIEEQLNAELDFFAQWARHGRTLRAKVLALESRPATQAVAELMGIETGASVIHIERLRFSGAVPVAIDIRYVAQEFHDVLTRDWVARKSILDLLRGRYTLKHVDYRIEAMIAGNDDRAQHLQVMPGAPLIVRKLHYVSERGASLMCGHSLYRSDQVRFAIRVPLAPRDAAPILVHEYRR